MVDDKSTFFALYAAPIFFHFFYTVLQGDNNSKLCTGCNEVNVTISFSRIIAFSYLTIFAYEILFQ